jgi:hypothetical protein
MTTYWWLSFSDNERPSGSRFLGACIVTGTDLKDAIATAHLNHCNPGGEVLGHSIVPSAADRIPPHRLRVLLDKETAEALESEFL